MRWYPDVILTEILKKKTTKKTKTKQKRMDTIRQEI